jgi:hypothetical protein
MPAPSNERQRLELELGELPAQIAALRRELENGRPHRARRERLLWTAENLERAAAGAEGQVGHAPDGAALDGVDPRPAGRPSRRGRRPSIAKEARSPVSTRRPSARGAQAEQRDMGQEDPRAKAKTSPIPARPRRVTVDRPEEQ